MAGIKKRIKMEDKEPLPWLEKWDSPTDDHPSPVGALEEENWLALLAEMEHH